MQGQPLLHPTGSRNLAGRCPHKGRHRGLGQGHPGALQLLTKGTGDVGMPPEQRPNSGENHSSCPAVFVRLCPRSPARPAPGDAPLASLLEEMDTPSLEGSVPGSPTPQSRTLPSTTRPPSSAPAGGEHPRAPRKGPGEEDDLYYGLQEEPDALLKESDKLFEPEN